MRKLNVVFKRLLPAACAMCMTAASALSPAVNCGADGGRVSAKAAVVIELESARVLFSQNSNDSLPMASTTKIMTALLALRQPDIHSRFRVDDEAIMVEGSSMGLRAGDEVSLYDLAVGMLLCSGNDAANAAAVAVSGSIEDFAQLMNQTAAEIGMKNSSFVSPSGLDAPEHYSTAYDMALLAREALFNEDFLDICSSSTMVANYGNPPYKRTLSNHNRLLREYDGAIGVKTGFTKKSGRCLVSAATRDGVTLICVTLNASDDWNIHKNLLNDAFKKVEAVDVSEFLTPITLPVAGGVQQYVALQSISGETVTLPLDSRQKVKVRYNLPRFVHAPVRGGQVIGSAVLEFDGKDIKELTLFAAQDVLQPAPVEKKGFFEKLFEWLG